MSNIWSGEEFRKAERISGFGELANAGRGGGPFRSLYAEVPSSRAWNVTFPGQPTMPDDEIVEQEDPVELAAREGFLQGFQEGERLANEAHERDDDVRAELAAAIAQIAQAGEGVLAAMISKAVVRLVGQIIGEVEIDEAVLLDRCAAVAACIEGDEASAVIEAHPQDVALLQNAHPAIAVSANAELPRGSVRLATAEGWIEDGPEVRLARLKALLDGMEGKR